MKQKRQVTLYFVYRKQTGRFKIESVQNSVEWVPGEHLTRQEVEEIIDNRTEITINIK